jgi:hypothetical protein
VSPFLSGLLIAYLHQDRYSFHRPKCWVYKRWFGSYAPLPSSDDWVFGSKHKFLNRLRYALKLWSHSLKIEQMVSGSQYCPVLVFIVASSCTVTGERGAVHFGQHGPACVSEQDVERCYRTAGRRRLRRDCISSCLPSSS